MIDASDIYSRRKGEKTFSVWIDTEDGGLAIHGASAGKAMDREAAWRIVRHYQSESSAKYIRVLHGCSQVWGSAKTSEGWTR